MRWGGGGGGGVRYELERRTQHRGEVGLSRKRRVREDTVGEWEEGGSRQAGSKVNTKGIEGDNGEKKRGEGRRSWGAGREGQMTEY